MLPSEHGLPGAAEAGVASSLAVRAASWDPGVRKRVAVLVTAWDLTPLFSKHRRRFSSLPRDEQLAWVDASYRSKATLRRLQITALKQLLFLEWASSPVVEDALGYDYRCARDDEVHGTRRALVGEPRIRAFDPEPEDYYRPGPAITDGAIPRNLLSKRDFSARPEDETRLETASWPDLVDGATLRCDVVVVGSGAGGAVVATELAEAGVDVVVVEEGEHVTSDDFDGPMFCRFQRFCRDNGMTQVVGRPPIPLPLGKVVGGTTVVNSGTCFRAPERVLQRWESEDGVEGASLEALTPHYEVLEDFLNVRPVPWELLGPNGMAAHRGAVALGLSGGPLLRNIADCHGCGQCAFGCPTNAKQAMHVSYLPRAWRAGARILSRARVDRIEVTDGRARGVTGRLVGPEGRPRGSFRVVADHVVLAAGAVHTPGLLADSGVPDRSGQTGRNLRIHPATGVGAYFDDDVVNWKGTLQSYYIDAFFDTHELMFEATTTVPSIGAGSVPGIGAAAMAELGAFRQLATLGFYVSDTSRGRVYRLRNAPLPVYRLNELDAKRMSIGIAVAAEVLLAAGAKRVYTGLPGLDAVSSRDEVRVLRERRVRRDHLRLTAFHPMGTARMGADPERAVVDPYGRHHSTANLWVADASTFPSCVGVNPQMTIMAFARRTAQRITNTA